jgi:hypothetical protein
MARFRDNRATIIKDLELDPAKLDELQEMGSTPRYLSQFIGGDKIAGKERIKKDLMLWPAQNRAYRRAMRKPLQPNNIRRAMRDTEKLDQLAQQEAMIKQARKGSQRGKSYLGPIMAQRQFDVSDEAVQHVSGRGA